jgi:phosphopantothenoylcysteine decarboxylase/phosphopantothenate--cysteine ligase
MSVKKKKILIGVCGSIAAYKSATLVRLLKKAGAEVKIILTPSAKEFITPLTLSTLSKNPVYCEFVKNAQGEWTNHVDLGLWADIFLIAPLTANTLAKMANGLCDNLLLATYLSARCPVIVAPAMDLDMLNHPTTQTNINKIKSFGNLILEPEFGELASGLVGKGRMAEPEEIFRFITNFFKKKEQLKNKTVLITAGPTYENIDPVRFIGNHSSGKMGFALAQQAALQGANVYLITGPTHLTLNHPSIKIIPVQTAHEMLEQCKHFFPQADIGIFAAAVADYRPAQSFKTKIKKSSEQLTLVLEKNPDILATMAQIKKKNQLLIGFALETNNELKNAKEKLIKKKLDFIVLNSLKNKGAGFKHDTNQISILDKNFKIRHYSLKPKQEVAADILDYTIALLKDEKN